MTKTRDLANLGGGFTQAGTGAVQRTVESKLQDVVSVLDFIPEAEHAAIQDNTSTYDCSDALQAALAASGSVYIPKGTYNTTKTINLTVDAGVDTRVRLLGEGGCKQKTIIKYTPSVEGDPAFRVNTAGTEIRGFRVDGPGRDNRTNPEIAFDFRKPDLTGGGSQQGTLIEDMQITNFGKAGLYFCQQWLAQVNLCRFISCGQANPSVGPKTGGVVFDSTGSGLSGWSSSGIGFNDVYFASCSYGIYADSAWNLTTYGCIFEYCHVPYYRSATGNTHTMVTPWFENNTNPPEFNGGVVIQGGRGVSYGGTSYVGSCVTHIDDGIKLIRSGTTQFEVDVNGDVSLGSSNTGILLNDAGVLSGTSGGFKFHINPNDGGAPENYIVCGPTDRNGNGLNKLLVSRHGYYGGSDEEVASIGVETGSSAGGSGTGTGALVIYTGSSGNGDGGSTSAERVRIRSNGTFGVKGAGTGGVSDAFVVNGSAPANSAQIDSLGRLLVGTSSSLESTSYIQSFRSSGANAIYLSTGSLGNNEGARLIVRCDSPLRFGQFAVAKHSSITNPVAYLDLNQEDGNQTFFWFDNSGVARTSSTFFHVGTTSGTVIGTQTSDQRLKNVGDSVVYGLNEIKQLQPKQYALKTDPDVNRLGFIAQEVESIIPEAVFDTNEELEGHKDGDRTKLGIEYVQLIPVLVNAIKELSAENADLAARITALESA